MRNQRLICFSRRSLVVKFCTARAAGEPSTGHSSSGVNFYLNVVASALTEIVHETHLTHRYQVTNTAVPPWERCVLQQQHAMIVTPTIMMAIIDTFSKHSLLQLEHGEHTGLSQNAWLPGASTPTVKSLWRVAFCTR